MSYRLSKDKIIYEMTSLNKPELYIESGSRIIFETIDAFGNQISSTDMFFDTINWNKINPATGPVYINGAHVGNTLEIKIIRIDVADYGVIGAIPKIGLFGEIIKKSEFLIMNIDNKRINFIDNITFNISPMIGVIGVAPDNKKSIPCGYPGYHGGNMDNRLIKEGSVLYLPIFAEGALLSLGDLHALMGDGEIVGTGIEIGGEVEVEVSVRRDFTIKTPMLLANDYLYVIVSKDTIEEAMKESAYIMQHLLMERLKISSSKAAMFCSALGNLEICQVVDPLVTIRFGLPLKLLGGF